MVKITLKCIGTVFCIFGLIVYTLMPFLSFDPANYFASIIPAAILDGLMILFIWLMWRKRPPKVHTINGNISYTPPTPKPVQFSNQQIEFDRANFARQLEILQDCINLLNSTMSADVFFSRLNLAFEKTELSIPLQGLDAKTISGYRNIQTSLSEGLEEVVDAFIDRVYAQEQLSANRLKTDAGRKRRMQSFADTLASDFAHVSIAYTRKLFTQGNLDRIAKLRNEQYATCDFVSERGTVLTESANPAPIHSVADEIIKLKNLLDTGAISQVEFEAFKQQLHH